ncbi:MAG: Crp/Fnr family transcriptional regulator [Myxococcota bacterium]
MSSVLVREASVLDEIDHPILSAASPEAVRRLIEGGEHLTLERGTVLLQSGLPASSVNLVLSGYVRLYTTSDDQRQLTTQLLTAPATFGDMEALANEASVEHVEALTDVQTITLPVQAYTQFLRGSPGAARAALYDFAARFCVTSRFEVATLFDVPVRAATFVLTLLDLFGQPVMDGFKIRLPLTQADLATHLGVNVRSITRTLKDWKNQNIVSFRKGWLVVHDRSALEALSQDLHQSYHYRAGTPLSDQFLSRPVGRGPEVGPLSADARTRLRKNPIFAKASEDQLAALLVGARLLNLQPRDLLFRAGDAPDHVDFLIDGHIRVFHHHSQGREVTVKHLQAPSCTGDIRLINGTRHGENGEALLPTRAVRVSADRFRAFIENKSEVCFRFVYDVAGRCCMAKRHQVSQLFNADTRIASLLLAYLEAYGKPLDDGFQIRHALTQADIARELGVNIRSVNRAVQCWKEDGVLSLHKGWVVVHEPAKLAELAGSLRFNLGYRSRDPSDIG